jgi:hypothetical protein
VWDNAKEQRRLEAAYNEVIDLLEALRALASQGNNNATS